MGEGFGSRCVYFGAPDSSNGAWFPSTWLLPTREDMEFSFVIW